MNRDNLEALQLAKLRSGLAYLETSNPFYRERFQAAGVQASDIRGLEDLGRLPLVSKEDFLADQAEHPPYGSNLSRPIAEYTRLHQSTGTSGRRLRWLDSPQGWDWLTRELWPAILDAAEFRPDDRLFFTFSFGPFLGFWAAFEGAQSTRRFVLAGGGLSSSARLQMIVDHQITVVFSTPTYALRLAETAHSDGFPLKDAGVRAVVVAGEPGGSIPATRARIESAFNARVFDHSGMTEIGSLGAEFLDQPGKLFLLEDHCIAEFLDPETQKPVVEGELGELVLTNLGRWDSPAVRYRTGDMVRWRSGSTPRRAQFPYRYLEGGLLTRLDDMLWIKGNNVYPSAVEAVLREIPEMAEYRLETTSRRDSVIIVIEAEPSLSAELQASAIRAIQDRLYFRPDVRIVPPGTLPRSEMKSNRLWVAPGDEATTKPLPP